MLEAVREPVETVRWRRAGSRLAGPAILLVIIVGLFWKLTLTKQYTWLNSPDFAYQVLPWYQFQARVWHSGQFPLWDPYEWGGQTVMGQVITGAAYPLNWILFLMPLRHGWINQTYVHWYFVLIHYMGALFCFLLLRDLKRSSIASLLGAVAFATSGFFSTIDWPQMLNGAVWAPLVFLYFLRAMRGERPLVSSALSGMFLGVSLLSGHHQVPIFVGIAMAGLWLYHLVRMWMGRTFGPALAGLGLFATFAVLAGGLQTLPAIEYGRLAVRWVGASHPLAWNERVPYTVHGTFSLMPIQITGLLLSGVSDITYMGLAMFALAVFAIASAWEERMVRIFAAVALGALLFSFGPFTILHGLIYAVAPLVEKARAPSMAALIYNLGICVLAAYGLDAYRAEVGHQQNAWMRRLVLFLAAFGGLIFTYMFIYTPQKLEHPPNFNWLGIDALIAILLAAAFHGWNRSHISQRDGAVVVALLALLALGSLNGSRWPARDQGWPYLDPMTQNADVAEFLRSQPGMVRFEIDRSEIPYNFGDWYGIDGFDCYLASLTRNIETIRAHGHMHTMFGINFYVGTKPRPDTTQTPVFTGRTGMKVWAVRGSFPRAWSVHEAVRIHADGEIMENLNKSPAELARQTFMYGAPPKLETCATPDDVTLVARETNSLIVDANMRCKGMVIVGEGYFPGWQATVDGKPTPVYEAYTYLRGVVADAGHHRIEMRYRPRSVFWGGAMSAIGILGGCLLAALGKW